MFIIAALYKFTNLNHYIDLREPLRHEMESQQIKGTLLLAKEGINGTVCGSRQAIDHLIQWLKQIPQLSDLEHKEAESDHQAFYRTKVKLKKEIVTLGVLETDPLKKVGTYVESKDWNDLISRPDVIVIDTRNDYEIKIGTFKGAINPETETFREFPEYVKIHLDKNKHKHVAMYCTGGIRCEKSTSYLKDLGFENVYHLKGGILKYLEEIPKEESMWEGDCFVFDQRVAVDHHLKSGQYDQCYACRMPITETDKASAHYEKGISCPHCFNKTSTIQIQRFTERQKQINLAKKHGRIHIGNENDVNPKNDLNQ